MGGIEVRVLGPLALSVDGEPAAIKGPKQRAVLAMLALNANRVVPIATLVDAVWGEPAPDRAEHTLQQHVSALRKVVGPDTLATQSPGYVLRLDTTDAADFTSAAASGFDAIAASRWDEALTSLSAALAMWRGPALADARETARLEAAAVALDEQRLAATEAWIEVRLQVNQPRELIADLERLVHEHPLRERFRALLMLALYRSGRQADALAEYQAARQALIEDLGIEPGAELRELEAAILSQSPSLDRRAAGPVDADVYATFRADAQDVGRLQLPDGQTVLLIPGLALIGRDPSALVRLVDSRVSRRHAEIEVGGGRFVLRDLGSTNGTTVNGSPAESHELYDGDVVSIGGVELRFLAAKP